ncbi:MAG: hypothetical protein JXB62_21115 [Pirellulales bacterium]|nr:hypothetical protein [Pirellulales bacterium]
MTHIYAGILGPLAFLTSLARGFVHGGGAESTLWAAWFGLLAFSAIGYVIGCIAERTVEESVRGRIAAELAAEREAKEAGSENSGKSAP